jgi:hypothetical protein
VIKLTRSQRIVGRFGPELWTFLRPTSPLLGMRGMRLGHLQSVVGLPMALASATTGCRGNFCIVREPCSLLIYTLKVERKEFPKGSTPDHLVCIFCKSKVCRAKV